MYDIYIKEVMDIFSFRNYYSTKDEKVFGLRVISDFDNKILIQKAKRRILLDDFLKSSTSDEKSQFFICFEQLYAVIHHYLLESNRFSIILDTNIIQDILSSENDRKRYIRYMATSAMLYFIEDFANATVCLSITPTVLYELNEQKPISSVSDYVKSQKIIEQVAVKLGITTYAQGFHSYRDLRNKTSEIFSDSKRIKKAIEILSAQSWKMKFEHENGRISIPTAIAEDSIPNIKLSYFSPFYVKWALMNFVEKRMFEQNKDQRKARRMMNEGKAGISKLFRINKNGRLMGLADIELLSESDLRSQTSVNSPAITAAITYDKDLLAALHSRLGSIQHGGKFESGKDDPSDAAELFVYQFARSQSRSRYVEARNNMYLDALKSFCDMNFNSFR